MTHAAISPMRAAARMGLDAARSPFNPFADSYPARATAAACEMFISATRRYGKPDWGIESIRTQGRDRAVHVETALATPFCNLLRFRVEGPGRADLPKVLMIAPMSGHFATLLRGTVTAMLPGHEVWITDWADARDVPTSEGQFDLEDFTDLLITFCRHLAGGGRGPHVMAVCQPGVPMTIAAALMAEDRDPARPASVTLMGSPIDTSSNPKKPNELAASRALGWFETNVIVTVPWPNRGMLRRVYPGFLQLTGFMTMNLDRHIGAHVEHYQDLVKGDGESAEAHRAFYDEYMAVMDLTAEFYLMTIERVFQKRVLATGTATHRSRPVRPAAITDIPFLTIEGERDDITGLGQTSAVHRLLTGLPEASRQHFTAIGVGHYGVFNGSRWREMIQPRIAAFIAGRPDA
jgi:poly(3-hydroxybutyrate) depolymerase